MYKEVSMRPGNKKRKDICSYPDQYIHIDDFEKEFEKLCDEYDDELV